MRYSHVLFAHAFSTEKLEAFLEGHRLVFEWLGGVPSSVCYDNPKTAVTKILAGPAREEQQLLSSLRGHYLFDSDFCRPGEPHEKGDFRSRVLSTRLWKWPHEAVQRHVYISWMDVEASIDLTSLRRIVRTLIRIL